MPRFERVEHACAPGVEGFRVVPGDAADPGVRVRLASSPRSPLPPRDEELVESLWQERCRDNPRLYNGPLLSVVSVDHDAGEYQCRRDDFRRLLAQPRVRTGVRLLAVTGAVFARDAAGVEHLLLARRGAQTRIYPGMWEIAPCGGVAPPPAGVGGLGEADLRAHVLEEAMEELGMRFGVGPVCALVRDEVAHSEDLAMRCDAGSLDDARRGFSGANWELSEARWVPLPELEEFDASHAGEIIAASRSLFRAMGLIPPGNRPWVPGAGR